MDKCIVLFEDDPDLTHLVSELLRERDYTVIHVGGVDELLRECSRYSPCVALLDSTDPTQFDLWPLGPKLSKLGVPAVAFTAHASALTEFEVDSHSYAGVISKPFDADEFLNVVDSICWDEHQKVAS